MVERKTTLETDMERIKTQLSMPFEKADELAEKEKRLAELKQKAGKRTGKGRKEQDGSGRKKYATYITAYAAELNFLQFCRF